VIENVEKFGAELQRFGFGEWHIFRKAKIRRGVLSRAQQALREAAQPLTADLLFV
jgi:hypothetical protein